MSQEIVRKQLKHLKESNPASDIIPAMSLCYLYHSQLTQLYEVKN